MTASKPWLMPAVYILTGIVATVLIFSLSLPPRGTPIELTPAPTRMIVVQVDGQVVSPGVYPLDPDSRVEDAIAAAGGSTGEVDLSGINLARPLKDGEKVTIGQPEPGLEPLDGIENGTDGLIDLNTATVQELDSLPGIGETRANAIVTYRTEHGSFVNVEELLQVPGISSTLYDQIKDKVTVQ